MTCSTVGLVTQKKDGNCVAVLRDRMFILSLSISPVSDDSGSLFSDAFGPHGGQLHRKSDKIFKKQVAKRATIAHLRTSKYF